MKKLFMGLMAVVAVGCTPAFAEIATLVERDAGCPAVIPTTPVPNTNVVVLDRSALSKECLAKLYEQDGDPNPGDDDQ